MIKKNNKRNLFIVPDVGGVAREMTGKSQVGIVVSKFLSLSFANKLRFCFNNLPFLPVLLKMDFAVGVKVLCELEILKEEEKRKVREVVLHNQMVDMALALRNKKLLEYFFFLARKYSFIPGLKTYNIMILIKILSNFASVPRDLKIYSNTKELNEVILDYLENSSLEVIEIK